MLLTSIASVPGPEQNINIIDQVLNDDGTPAEGAIVSLYRDGLYVKSFTTLADGVYEFRDLIKAFYEIQIVFADEQGIVWRSLGKVTQSAESQFFKQLDIIPPVLNLEVENNQTTVSIVTPGSGYDMNDPPVIAADDGFTAIGIVNLAGQLTGLTSVFPGNGTASIVNTFNIPQISNYIGYYGDQSQTGGESTDDYSSSFYDSINAMIADIDWNSGPLGGRFSYFTSANINIGVGYEGDALTALGGKPQTMFPNYQDKGLFAYPAGTITYQANTTNFTPPSAWKGGAFSGSGAELSVTFDVYQYGVIDYSGFFKTKNNRPPGQTPEYVYMLDIPENHPNVFLPEGWLEQLYKPCGVKTSVYDFVLGMQEFAQAATDAKRYASNLEKFEVNADNLFKNNIKINWNNLKLLGTEFINAVSLFNILGPLVDDDIPIQISNQLENAPSMNLNNPYAKFIYFNTISKSDRERFNAETTILTEQVYKYLNSNGIPTSTNTGIPNPSYNPSLSIQTFNEIKGYLGAKFLPQIVANQIGGVAGNLWNNFYNKTQIIDAVAGTNFSQSYVRTTSVIADFFHQAGQAATTGEVGKNWSDFLQQSSGAFAGSAPQYLWGKTYMTPATEYGYAWVHNWNNTTGAYTITKVNLGL